MGKGKHTKAYLALIFICIVWGTTYLAIRVGVEHFPAAFLFAGIRQVSSGLIIMIAGYIMSKEIDISFKSLRHHLLVGFLLITVGNGVVTWAEKYVPSGVAALICSLMPIVTVIINLTSGDKEKLNPMVGLGMVLGFGGVGLIFKDNFADLGNTNYLLGIIGLLCATSSWALGSVINKRKAKPTNPIFNSGIQLFFGGAILFALSPLFDDYSKPLTWNAEATWMMAYLIVFGSVLAYTAYMYALKELPVGLVTTYAYVNPLVAVILGYFILSEDLNWYIAGAFLSIILGVYLVNKGYRKQQKKAQIKDYGNNAISALPNIEPKTVKQ